MLDNSASVSIHIGKLSTDSISITGSNLTSASSGLNTTGLTISNTTSAAAAVTALDTAISTKDTARGTFGYKINRLENSITALNVRLENLQAAESRITDADVAEEMAKMTRNQVLAQAGTAMLTQANAMPQIALKLFK